MTVDPVQVLGFVGLWCAAAGVLAGVWVVAVEFFRWRDRREARRRARAARARRVPPRAPGVWVEWSPEWGWPERS
jgi:type IV secretory pathway TrbD component